MVMKKFGFLSNFLRGTVKMQTLSRYRLLLLMCIIVMVSTTTSLAKSTAGRLLWPRLLEHAGLEILWEYDLPIIEKEKLSRMVIVGDRIYALSDQNYLFALNRQNGNVVFSRPFAAPGLVVPGFRLYNGRVISMVGNELIETDPETGITKVSKGMDFGVTCLAARNDSFFYIAGADGRLRVFRAKDMVKMFEAAAASGSSIVSVVADNDMAVFGTAAGEIVAISPDRPERLWQFKAGDSIVGPIARDGRSLFVASEDTYVYRIDVSRASRPVWKYQTAAILNRAPAVTQRAVYQYVNDKGLTAIDRTTGKFLWQVKGGHDLLAETAGRAYVLKQGGELVVMDNSTSKKLYSVNFAPVTIYATNLADQAIYVADEHGRIACIRAVK